MLPIFEEAEKVTLEPHSRKKEFLKPQQSVPTIMAETCYML
jgi:hypothetical protein